MPHLLTNEAAAILRATTDGCADVLDAAASAAQRAACAYGGTEAYARLDAVSVAIRKVRDGPEMQALRSLGLNCPMFGG